MISNDTDTLRPIRIAALLTCHNRKAKTLACLTSLFNQNTAGRTSLHAFVVDAGSSDGTSEEIRSRFPEVSIFCRSEDLFWCGGMRVAFGQAGRDEYDYCLWLNDDTVLLPRALQVLLASAGAIRRQTGRDGILVGSTRDPDTGARTYGGVLRSGWLRPLGFRPVQPVPRPLRCDTFNGNIVLVPRSIAEAVGNLSREFTHAIADTDYGLRAQKKGFSSWVVPGYVGLCRRNSDTYRWCDPNVPIWKRLQILRSPKGLPPREWKIFARRHAPIQWPVCWLSLYFRACFPRFWGLLHVVRGRK